MPPPPQSPRAGGGNVVQKRGQSPSASPRPGGGPTKPRGVVARKSNNNARVVAQLKQEVCNLQIRCEELEQERNYNAAKVHELTEIINSAKSGKDSGPENTHQALMEKSVKVAEISLELEKVQSEKVKIQKQRDSDREMINELNKVIKSLQCVAPNYNSDDGSGIYSSGAGSSLDDEDYEDDDDIYFDENDNPTPITAEKALQMTLKNMKFQVEIMEEERQRLANKCKMQSTEIKQLTNDAELQTIKIDMLTQLAQQDTVSLIERLRQELEMKDLKIEMLEQLVKANAICGGLGSTAHIGTKPMSQPTSPRDSSRSKHSISNSNDSDDSDEHIDDTTGFDRNIGLDDGLTMPSTPDGMELPSNTFNFDKMPDQDAIDNDNDPDSPNTRKQKKRLERKKRREEALANEGFPDALPPVPLPSVKSVRSADSTESAPQLSAPTLDAIGTPPPASSSSSGRKKRSSSSSSTTKSPVAASSTHSSSGDKHRRKSSSSSSKMHRRNSEPDLDKAKKVMQKRRERKAAEQQKQLEQQQEEEQQHQQEANASTEGEPSNGHKNSNAEPAGSSTPSSSLPLPSSSHDNKEPSKQHHHRKKSKTKILESSDSGGEIKLIINGRKATYKGGTADDGTGLPHGTGTLRFDNGDTYLGEMKYGDMHGNGTMYYSSRQKGTKRGIFKQNKYVGSSIPSSSST